MKLWDRGKEKEWLKRYLLTEPNAILFVYGPKSSGKTTLLMKVVEELPKDEFIYYWYDLREELITDYSSVIELFFTEKGWFKSLIDTISPKINLGMFEIDTDMLEGIRSKKVKPFIEMRKQLEKGRKKGQIPVIVFDELQKLKEVYLNGDTKQRPLVRELFNFFVRITKVLHLAHVIVMTSDTFFIEQVYTDSTLKNTSRFYLVDFFDDETAKKILISEGLSEEDANYAVEWIGGVPWMIEELLEGDLKETIQELFKQAKSKIVESTRKRKDLKDILRRVIEGENLYYDDEAIDMVKELVDKEILFMDPINGEVRFQTRLDERAAREILSM